MMRDRSNSIDTMDQCPESKSTCRRSDLNFSRNNVRRIISLAILLFIFIIAFVFIPIPAFAQSEASVIAGENISLWSTIRAGGIIGFLIALMSMVGLSLIIEHLLTIREKKLVPPLLAGQLTRELESGDFDVAKVSAEQDGSFLGHIIASGLARREGMFGFFEMQTAMQETSERQVSKLYRKLEYLTFIAATAPMLGLLGTVTGMIKSFNKIAQTQGAASPAELADGISEALITTCMGLVVAIPAIFFVSMFKNRIDSCVAEAELVVEKLMGRFRAMPSGAKS